MRQPENALIVKAGEGLQAAVPLGAGIFMSRGISNSYLVTTQDSDVLINSGMYTEAPEIKRRFNEVSHNPLRTIIFTQGHADHVGGWSQITGPEIETIAQANHADVREYWHRLQPYYVRRTGKLWSGDITTVDRSYQPPEPMVSTTFLDSHTFTMGARRFELYSTPGGETTDSLIVWLPEDRILFTGNLMGPLFGHVPNLYTIRGDKYRSGLAFIHSLDRLLALEPEVLITGHGEPITGTETIQRQVKQIRDATQSLRDQTIEGMNAGLDLWTLMGSITLPAELDIPQGHGKVPWIVRSTWEEHVGWFRYESTTELYDVPPAALWPELIELAGGVGVLTDRARTHVKEGRPLHALHLTDMVLAQEPHDPSALTLKQEALERLLASSGRENFSEVRWLEAEIRETKAALA